MANGLTGDLDAVVEVRVRAINNILASLHQNDASTGDDDSLSFPHSLAMRAGVFEESVAVVSKFLKWTQDLRLSPGGGVGGLVSPKRPPGVWKAYQDVAIELKEAQDHPTLLDPNRGIALVQVSAPWVSLPQGLTSAVTIHVKLRAHYIPDPGTPPLPVPIHGEIRATYVTDVKNKPWSTQKVLDVSLTSDDAQIQFLPAANTNLQGDEPEQIAAQIRRMLRNGFEPTSVLLEPGFAFESFKTLEHSVGQAIALPVTLTAAAPSPSALASVSNVFLQSNDTFAVAVSKEYVNTQLQGLKTALEGFSYQYVAPAWYQPDYDAAVTSVQIVWQTGEIRLIVQGHADTDHIVAPDFDFTIEQPLTLQVTEASQTVALVAGALSISVSGAGMWTPNVVAILNGSQVKWAIESFRDTALQSAQQTLDGQLLDNIAAVRDAVESFDASISAKLVKADIEPDGVVLRGRVTTQTRAAPVASFRETSDGTGFTALRSWIPAGWIERYYWSWLVESIMVPWGQAAQVHSDEHSFIFERPEGLEPETRVCLQVVGKQVNRLSGIEGFVSGGETCSANSPELVWMMPAAWVKVMTPLWGPDPVPEAVLEDAIIAHIDVLGHAGRTTRFGASALIHFADPKTGPPLGELARVLGERTGRHPAMALFLVMPRGFLSESRAAVERRLGSLEGAAPGWLAVTEDYEGGWSRTFGIERPPATYIMNGKGECVWQQLGPLDGSSLRSALDQHLNSGPPVRLRPLRLAVQPGDRALDVLFEHAPGEQMALRRLRGQRVLLSFWKSWLAPCLSELGRLQSSHDRDRREGRVVLAINDGEDRQRVAETRRAHRLTLTLVPDPERRISSRYGINCWPTTVAIDENGRVERVHFGVTRPDRTHEVKTVSGP